MTIIASTSTLCRHLQEPHYPEPPRETTEQSYKTNLKQTKTAHNAPLTYNSTDENNSYSPLPWNQKYIGSTSSSASFTRSQNTPVLTEGITTMVISGAYPLYRGSNASEYSGLISTSNPVPPTGIRKYISTFNSQYYITDEFWDPDFKTSQIDGPVAPNPPFNIKGGRIVLYAGQRVQAGSYVYSTVGMTGNVNISKFYPESAKEIILNKGFEKYILGDVYSKYQSNQGGVIVLVVEDSKPPPTPPPNAQPIGIVLEDIVGFGEPNEDSQQTQYLKQKLMSTEFQTVPDFENTYQLQNREILIQLFDMYPNMGITGFPTTCIYNYVPFATTVAAEILTRNLRQVLQSETDKVIPGSTYYSKIKSLYTIPDSRYAFNYNYGITGIENLPIAYDIKSKQIANDWPGPQSASNVTLI